MGAAIGADTAVPPPQELHPLGADPHELQPEGAAHESQLTAASQLFRHLKILASKPRLPILRPHPLSQDGAPQGSHAEISAPQLGPQLGAGAAQPDPQGAAISAPQLGPQAVSAPQLGAQAELHASLLRNPLNFDRRADRIGRRGPQHDASTPQLGAEPHEAISAPQLGPQLGAAPQPDPHGAAISAPQLGPAPHPDPHGAAISAPQDGSETDVSQHELEAPQPRPPSKRDKRSPPKLWPQRLALSTIDPTRMFNFIEPNLPTYILSLTKVHKSTGTVELRPVSAHEVAAEIALYWRGIV